MSLFSTISGWFTRPTSRLEQRLGALERKQHMDNAAVNERLDKIEADLDEASTEITAELAKLREEIANGGQTTALLARLDGIAGRAKKLADIIKPEEPPVDPAPSA